MQPTNLGNRLLQGPIEGANGRNLGLPPYGITWNTNHSYVRSTRFSIRVYKDIFDRINERDFHWVVYNMESPEISTLDDRCRTHNWMSECSLIMMAIVELHHPNRVLRQFGCVQGVPSTLDLSRPPDYRLAFFRILVVTGDDTIRVGSSIGISDNQWPMQCLFMIIKAWAGYMGWYRSITRLIISPRCYASNLGYQSADIVLHDEVYHMIGCLNIAANEVTTSSTPFVEALKHASYDVVRNASRLLGRPPLNYEPYITESSGHCAAEPSTAGHYTAGPSTQEHYPVWQSTVEGSTSRPRGRGNSASRDYTHSEVPNFNEGYIPHTETPFVYIPQSVTPSVYIPQSGMPSVYMPDLYTQQYNSFTGLLQTNHPPVGYGYGGYDQTDFGPPQYNRSPIPFTGYASPAFITPMDVVEGQNEQEEQGGDDDRRRGARQRRAPPCGTNNHRRMH
ncbi:hypothetical protein ACS0TY_014371 [Phlomoides rotata]